MFRRQSIEEGIKAAGVGGRVGGIGIRRVVSKIVN